MAWHFLSDCSYFLLGVRSFIPDEYINVIYLHTRNIEKYTMPEPGDVVILNIADVGLRRYITSCPDIAACRVIMLLEPPFIVQNNSQQHFPWILPCNISPDMLKRKLHSAQSSPLVSRRHSHSELRLFRYMATGLSIEQVQQKMRLPKKSLYAMKRAVLSKYGIEGGKAHSVLLCRDAMKIM
ncbi:hypothetical protein [Klebsiella oxytoca]|uniref:LuxR family transcriptional regulator n=1 Tax=Klebsiella oxytoca TaxID=571 RepID=A0A6B8MVJ7_KLEOX|nr:hypothetical protein [Klebsiella oxytoca]QGN36741.1 hypothetical protein GJ746_05295 [Klebsiella oxytoca]